MVAAVEETLDRDLPVGAGLQRLAGRAVAVSAREFALLEALAERPECFCQWYFGHHHRDDAAGKLRCLWQHMALEDSVTGHVQRIEPPV